MMRIGMVVPGFSADPSDWCIPALRHLARGLAVRDDVRVVAVRYPYHSARYTIDGAEVIALGGALRHRARDGRFVADHPLGATARAPATALRCLTRLLGH